MAKELFEEWLEGEVQKQITQLASQLQSVQQGTDVP
jgi:hypothetical protein